MVIGQEASFIQQAALQVWRMVHFSEEGDVGRPCATLVTQAEAFNLLTECSGNSREITADRSPGRIISSSFNTCSNFRALVTFQSWSLSWTIQSLSHYWLYLFWKSILGPNFLIWHARLLSVALSRMWALSGKDRVLLFVVLTGWLAACIWGGKCKLTNCEEEQGGEGEEVEGSNYTNSQVVFSHWMTKTKTIDHLAVQTLQRYAMCQQFALSYNRTLWHMYKYFVLKFERRILVLSLRWMWKT